MGDAAETLAAAAACIERIVGVRVTQMSALYRSEPAYLATQPEFCNAVLLVQVELEPLALLHALQAVEQEFGRVRTVPNGPRSLDVDIIDYEGVTSDRPELLLPHPLALERDFVVTPLLELSPGYVLANGIPVTREGVTCGWVEGAVAHHQQPSDTCKGVTCGWVAS
jgi:dihydropteroate synthase